ncbi:hypothetical protein HYP58_gp30 [Vibrio phage 1.097.O._10N.286.49.B3]|uniref:Uncharacterized protein n=1 Tax=Vibrio phage 1.097.O._10N.286.49.B3 TaxID=1881383 RepID=A0A2I7R0J1_9CAUD|nr:hypothetical protein HYP58_gp30 [Vibrio phage 1.097.O._10N.286.49.B3]AUR87176.1 hypothetical protein NVP1097O_30 [Vibrio phage 1.097.O._10N.286.49.B3]
MLEIIKSLKIKVTQADVEQALIELIAKQDPTIIVDSIEFAAKRSGKDSIAVSVEAHFGDVVEEPKCGPGPSLGDVRDVVEEVEVAPEVTDEEDEAPFETEAETVTAKTSLFG